MRRMARFVRNNSHQGVRTRSGGNVRIAGIVGWRRLQTERMVMAVLVVRIMSW